MPATEPPVIPDFELLRRIGGGAYGEVWLARSATGAWRALKIVWRHTFEDDRPFQREFEGIQHFERLSREHPSQIALFHVGRGKGNFYYVMELADQASVAADVRRLTSQAPEVRNPKSEMKSEPPDVGCYIPHTLRADLKHGRLPAARVLETSLALTEALSHLHTNGLVHRDVKPSNVIFVNGRPKLADIGLLTDAGDTRSIVGTEGYLAPEGPGTPQADLFALGKVLYEAATSLDRRQLPQLPPDLRTRSDIHEDGAQRPNGINAISHDDLVACLRGVHGGLNVRRGCSPVGVGRRRDGASHIHVAHRRRGARRQAKKRQRKHGAIPVVHS
jgi:eukaryotic-like serine/threonine-protein kinase